MKNKGFTLIEVLLSVFIISVAVLALYNGISYAYNSIEKAQDKLIAAYLAQEGIELVKNIRDTNHKAGNNWKNNLENCSGTYGCRMDYNDLSLTVNNQGDEMVKLKKNNYYYNYNDGQDTIFSRKIIINEIDDNKIRVASIIYFGNEEFLIEEILYNWKYTL